ncbi:MAG: polysaccharide deacetylase, partial [Acidobacteriota bacterium]|nr:polysaccharide deacetylase [Acidobacteriota bacterium]
LKPYEWRIGEKRITEIPVTTLPFLKTPIHASYVIYLATFSKTAARQYWRMALKMCRGAGVQPSLLLHPLDFLSGDDARELEFFPAMRMDTGEKIDFLSELLERYSGEFDVVCMKDHAANARKNGALKLRDAAEIV